MDSSLRVLCKGGQLKRVPELSSWERVWKLYSVTFSVAFLLQKERNGEGVNGGEMTEEEERRMKLQTEVKLIALKFDSFLWCIVYKIL